MNSNHLVHLEIIPKTFSDLGKLISQASFLEVRTPKPGNIGPNIPGQDVLYSQFKSVAMNMGTWVNQFITTKKMAEFGDLADYLVDKMLEAGSGQNLLLGHILLLSPLALAAGRLLSHPKGSPHRSWEAFWSMADQILRFPDPEQAVLVGQAIRKSQAGGLSTSDTVNPPHRYDLYNPEFDRNILEGGISVRELMKMSVKYDSVGLELATNYTICKHIFRTWLVPNFSKYSKLEQCTLELYLIILSRFPDTLIARKTNLETALKVQARAKSVLSAGGSNTKQGRALIQTLDQILTTGEMKLNPGTTADLVACILFLGLLFGIIDSK